MNNKITNFWRSLKFWFALRQGNNSLANQILKAIENSAEFSVIWKWQRPKNHQFNQQKNSLANQRS
ncbi:MAG: hypothetical protein F6K22_17495 [Okeania sp. SIO2F4]|uniref:hypothetical protein n=1 Tax=Okeania sp. SIO2F4 TaxID=2607790 RepID=UPI001429E9F3|nr:hypothetical protein [Okeania sp. SIO2F4]NES04464.1 hypothetical protein [Okeania sp. SIO2F4]